MASRSLGTLTLDVIAQVGGFVAGLDKAERGSSQWRKSVEKDAKAVGVSLASAATAAVGLGTASLVMLKHVAENTAETNNWAKSLNIATSTLQAWEYAAQSAGLSGDKMADIFKDLGDKIGDAVITGGGEAIDVLNKLGLKAEDLAKMTPDKQLLAIGDALGKIGTQSEKINILESLGNDLSKLLPLLDNGAAGLKNMLQQAKDFGISMSPKQIDDLVKANTLIKSLGAQVDGLKNQFVAGLANVDLSPLQNSLDTLRDVVTDPAFQQGMADLASGVVQLVAAASKGVAQLPSDLKSLVNQYKTLKAEFFGSAKDQHLAGVATEQQTNDNLAAYLKAGSGLNKFVTNPTLAVGDLFGQDLTAAKKASDERLASYNAYTKQMGWVEEKTKDVSAATAELASQQKTLTGTTTGASGSVTKLLDSYDKLNKLQSDRATLVDAQKTDSANAARYQRSIDAIDKQIAALNGSAKATAAVEAAQKKLQGQFADTEQDYQRQIALINTDASKSKDATEVQSLQFDIVSGKLKGLSSQQQDRLVQLATELDRLKQLKKANEDNAKAGAYAAQLQAENDTATAGFNISLAGAGEGDKQRQRLQELLQIRQEFNDKASELEKQHNAGEISQELYDKETGDLQSALDARYNAQLDYYDKLDEAQSDWLSGAQDAWQNYADTAQNYQQQAADFVSGTLDDLTNDTGNAFSQIIQGQESAGDAVSDLASSMAQSIIGALTKMAAQWLIYQGVQLIAGKTAQSSAALAMVANAQATSFQAELAAFASTAAIPIVGPALAPAAAAAAALATAPMVAGVAAASLSGMAHDGIDAVPETGTWLLQKGERVTTAGTSAKLDRTLDQVQSSAAGGRGGNVTFNAPVTVQAQPGMSDEDARTQGKTISDAIKQQMGQFLDREMAQGGRLWRR